MTVTCFACGVDYELSARREYEHRQRGKPNLCAVCRHPPRPPDPRMLAAMRRWSLEKYSLAVLRSWPPL